MDEPNSDDGERVIDIYGDELSGDESNEEELYEEHQRPHHTFERTLPRMVESPQQVRSSHEDEQQSPELSWLDLYRVGALNLPNPQLTDLDNEVHPIFRRRNFDSTPEQYDQILPCLRLASRILDDPHALHWFDALLNCPRTHLPEATKLSHDLSAFPDPTFDGQNDFPLHIGDRYLFNLRNPFEAHRMMAVQETLRTFEDAIIFNFHDDPMQADARRDHPFRQGFKSIISLDLCTLRCLASPRTHSIPQSLRTQFFYTANIVHEIAHAVAYSIRRNDWEDYFENDRLSECGYSLEQAIFGGRITTATDIEIGECTGALYFHDWPDFEDFDCPLSPPRWLAPPDSSYTRYVVPMHYVQMLFLSSFWEAKNMAAAGEITLRIPKTVGERVWNDGKLSEGYARLLEAEHEVHVAHRAAEFGVMVRDRGDGYS